MTIVLYTGKPGTGKSLTAARKIEDLLRRNIRWYKKSGEVRKIYTNLKLSPVFVGRHPEFFGFWTDIAEVCSCVGADIVWDEVANQMDAAHWQLLPLDVKIFLREHEKRGCDIYATTQNFPAVDVQFRRLVNELYECRKLMGSSRPGPCKKPPKRVWGVIQLFMYDPMTYDSTPERMGGWLEFFWSWFWFDKELVAIYDTLQSIPQGKFPPLRHIERVCNTCGDKKVIHT